MIDNTDSVVVPWFSKSHYPQVLELMDDAALLPSTYSAWRAGYREQIRHLRRERSDTVVVRIDPRAFRIWCEAEELPCNAETRLEFAELLADFATDPRTRESRHFGRPPAVVPVIMADWRAQLPNVAQAAC